MLDQTKLVIRLTPGTLKPRVGQPAVNCLSGGPETLLRWLETQLGLPVPTSHIASRITEYAAALDTLPESTITASLKNDRWETASQPLSRRDELLLSGWDESESESLPEVVNDLARTVIENGGSPIRTFRSSIILTLYSIKLPQQYSERPTP